MAKKYDSLAHTKYYTLSTVRFCDLGSEIQDIM